MAPLWAQAALIHSWLGCRWPRSPGATLPSLAPSDGLRAAICALICTIAPHHPLDPEQMRAASGQLTPRVPLCGPPGSTPVADRDAARQDVECKVTLKIAESPSRGFAAIATDHSALAVGDRKVRGRTGFTTVSCSPSLHVLASVSLGVRRMYPGQPGPSARRACAATVRLVWMSLARAPDRVCRSLPFGVL